MFVIVRNCNWCGTTEERLFTDSWTGTDLCLECIGRVVNTTTNSPATEGDNLHEQLLFRAGDRKYDADDKEEEEVCTPS